MFYAIYCEDCPDSIDKRRSVHKAHLQRLEELRQEQRLLLAGALYGDDSDNPMIAGFKGSVIIAEFQNVNHAKAWIAADPFVTAGVFSRIFVHPFKQVLP